MDPELSHAVFVVKGLLAALGVVMLVAHMDRCWDGMRDGPQRARYLCLLGFGVLVAGASMEQVATGADLAWRHWGSLVMSTALVATAAWSIMRSRRG